MKREEKRRKKKEEEEMLRRIGEALEKNKKKLEWISSLIEKKLDEKDEDEHQMAHKEVDEPKGKEVLRSDQWLKSMFLIIAGINQVLKGLNLKKFFRWGQHNVRW